MNIDKNVVIFAILIIVFIYCYTNMTEGMDGYQYGKDGNYDDVVGNYEHVTKSDFGGRDYPHATAKKKHLNSQQNIHKKLDNHIHNM